MPVKQYDLFISYSRDDQPWVQRYLHARLLACRKPNGARPEVFLDVSPMDGLAPGVGYLEELASAIESSDHFVAVYSRTYFAKRMTKWELGCALMLAEKNCASRMRILPVLIHPEVEVPLAYRQMHYESVATDTWFEALARAAGLTIEVKAPRLALRFRSVPTTVVVNHTLPVVEVDLVDEDGDVVVDDVVELTGTAGELSGTLTVRTEKAVAQFDQLSFSVPTTEARLVAHAPGCEEAQSGPIRVVVPPTEPGPDPARTPTIERDGEALFFANGRAVVVLCGERCSVHARDGSMLREVVLAGAPRVVRSRGSLVAVGTWTGEAYLFRDDGAWRQLVPTERAGFRVPGDVAVSEDVALIGYWSGAVWVMGIDREPTPVLDHESGVQAMALVDNRLFICGLDGVLWLYAGKEPQGGLALEREVLSLDAGSSLLVAAGSSRLFQVDLNSGEVVAEAHDLGPIHSVHRDSAFPVLVDVEGRGLRFDGDLVRRSFRVRPGAVATSADDRFCATGAEIDRGSLVAFRYPDGSRVLMRNSSVVHSQPDGALAVSRDGSTLAIGTDGRIRLFDSESYLARSGG